MNIDAKIRRMWLAGRSGHDIGVAVGLSQRAVYGRVRKMGLPYREGPSPRPSVEEMEHLREALKMAKQIIAEQAAAIREMRRSMP